MSHGAKKDTNPIFGGLNDAMNAGELAKKIRKMLDKKKKNTRRTARILDAAGGIAEHLSGGTKDDFQLAIAEARNRRNQQRNKLRPAIQEFSRQALLRRGLNNSNQIVRGASQQRFSPSVATTGTTLLRTDGQK